MYWFFKIKDNLLNIRYQIHKSDNIRIVFYDLDIIFMSFVKELRFLITFIFRE